MRKLIQILPAQAICVAVILCALRGMGPAACNSSEEGLPGRLVESPQRLGDYPQVLVMGPQLVESPPRLEDYPQYLVMVGEPMERQTGFSPGEVLSGEQLRVC